MMFQRICNPLLSNSFFLFGARGTGKTMLIESLFKTLPHLGLDLLDDAAARKLRKEPNSLRTLFAAKRESQTQWVVLDEVQRVPKILNTVHQMIEKDKANFALTGSSARKLKRGGANLLAGRAFVYHLFPFTFLELGNAFQLEQVLTFGTLPKLYSLSNDLEKKKYLNAYALTYVKEEIVAEQIFRSLDPFQDFLQVSAQMNGKIINHLKISKEVGVDSKTIVKYFTVLEETWMGFRLPGYHNSVRKAQVFSPKFYWFDIGVKRTLEEALDYPPAPGTSYFGDCFESLVVNEVFRLNSYFETKFRLSYLATSNSDVEVDLVLDKGRGRELVLIEIKSSTSLDEVEIKKLAKVSSSFKNAKSYYLSLTEESEIRHGVRCFHWQKGLQEIFGVGSKSPEE